MRAFLVAAALGASLAAVAASAAQSLADLARAAETARNATAGRPATKVYTNKDLPAVDPPPAPPSADHTAANSTAPAPAPLAAPGALSLPPAGTSPASLKNEAYWRERMRPLRERLDRARALADGTKRRAEELMRAADRCFMAAVVCAEYTESLRLTEEHKGLAADVARAEQDVEALEEEARRAGVPPGWLRE